MKIGIQLKHEEISRNSELQSRRKKKQNQKRRCSRNLTEVARAAIRKNPCEIFVIFFNPLPHLTFFWFLFVFFPISPYVIVFILYTLVICIDLVVYNTPKEHFVSNFWIIEVLGSLLNKLPFSLISLIFFLFFSLAKHPLRMISQRMSS